jgi:hypothetical protein
MAGSAKGNLRTKSLYARLGIEFIQFKWVRPLPLYFYKCCI